MTSSLEFIRTQDPRLFPGANGQKEYGVLTSGSTNTFIQFRADSISNSALSFTCTPPSKQSYINRCPYLTVKTIHTFTGTSAGVGIPLMQFSGYPHSAGVSSGTNNTTALRCLPLSNSISGLNVTINGSETISTPLNQYVRVLQRYGRDMQECNSYLSTSPSMPDNCSNYDDAIGSYKNVLGTYFDQEYNPRGGFTTGVLVTRNDSTAVFGQDVCVVEVTVTEPLFCSPWAFSQKSEVLSLSQIQQLNINMTFQGRGRGSTGPGGTFIGGLPAAYWSHAPSASALVSANTEIVDANISFNFMSPSLGDELPMQINYNFHEVQSRLTSSNNVILAGQTGQIVFNAVQLSTIPNNIYVVVQETGSLTNISSTDTYAAIDKVSISYSGQDNLLSGANRVQLYQMALRNGCNLSYEAAYGSKRVGLPLAIRPGLDLPLDVLDSPGLRSQTNFGMTVDFTNTSGSAKQFELLVLFINEGVLTVVDGVFTRNTAVLSREIVAAVKGMPAVAYNMNEHTFYGGSFWSDFWNTGKKIARGAINVGKMLSPIVAPELSGAFGIADQGAKAFGFGLRGKSKKSYKGGKMISAEEMKRCM